MEKVKKNLRSKTVYAFIDAANLFYGGEKSLRWRVDYERLIKYLREKLSVNKVFYYSGIDVDQYKAEEGKAINLDALVKYYEEEMQKPGRTEEETKLLESHLKRARLNRDLAVFGYELRIKPTKVFTSAEGTITKANCDVDLTFDMMRYMSQYGQAIVLSGDGDFAPVLEYLKKKHKKITILARAERTAREIKELAGEDFIDFKSLRKEIEAKNEKVSGGKEKPRQEHRKNSGGRPKREESREEPKRVVLKKIPTFRKGF